MTQYVIADQDGRVRSFMDADEPPEIDGALVAEMDPPVPCWPTAPTSTSVLHLIDGALDWVETATLDEIKAATIAKTFTDVDAVIWDAVGNRTREYELSEQAARAFAAAGYQGDASRLVTSYALNNPTLLLQSNEWAAQNIIARANAFDWATEEMRDKRMHYGVRMQAAATHVELSAAVASWNGFIAWLRATLQLPEVS